jgi:hypothetical protein
MSSREEFEAWYVSGCGVAGVAGKMAAWQGWQGARQHESDLLSAIQAITNSGPDAIPIKEAFEMAHRAIERATGGKV